MSRLRPSEWQKSIYTIDLPGLVKKGIKGLIVDLDNTLVGWNEPLPSQGVRDWLAQVQQLGLKIVILSNNNGQRVKHFARDLAIPYIPKARKPFNRGFQQALATLGLQPQQVAVIGDQIFTDVLGGNRLGLYTILVVPINPHEFIGTRFVRLIERRVLRRLTRRGLKAPQ